MRFVGEDGGVAVDGKKEVKEASGVMKEMTKADEKAVERREVQQIHSQGEEQEEAVLKASEEVAEKAGSARSSVAAPDE